MINYDLVIISFNACKYLEELILSFKLIHPRQIVIVDNASTDFSQELLKKLCIHYKFLYLPQKENLGYARACNLGASFCTSEIIGFLNCDTQFVEDINPMIEYLMSDDKIAIVGPRQIDEKGFITHGGIFGIKEDVEFPMECNHRGWKEKDMGQYNDIVKVPTISGSAFFIKRDVFNAMGGFLETKHFFEETFLVYKTRFKGYNAFYYGETVMIHSWNKSKGGEDRNQLFRESRKMFIDNCVELGIPLDKEKPKPPLKIVSLSIIRNEEKRYLRKFLDSLQKNVDEIYIVDDCSNDNTVAVCKEYSKVKVISTDKPTFFNSEREIRQKAWNFIYPHLVVNDLVVVIDGDEVIPDTDYQILKEKYLNDLTYINFLARFYHFWGNEQYYRTDKLWNPELNWGWRITRYKPLSCELDNKEFATNPMPTSFRKHGFKKTPDIHFFHLGYARDEDIKDKYKRYSGSLVGDAHSRKHIESIVDPTPTLKEWKEEKKLFIGCINYKSGYIHIDIDNHKIYNANKDTLINLNIIGDTLILPVKNDSVDEIFTSELLEHLPRYNYKDALKEYYRVLVSDGYLDISVPDLTSICQSFASSHIEKQIELLKYIYGGQEFDTDYHKTGFSWEILAKDLLSVGFKELIKQENDKGFISYKCKK